MHVLEQLEVKGKYKGRVDASYKALVLDTQPSIERINLYITISITGILHINPVSESFMIKYRLYFMWEAHDLDLVNLGFSDLAVKSNLAEEHLNPVRWTD